jgi:hypothetical protein
LFVPIELGIGHQAGVVVEEGKEKDLALLIRVGGVGEVGTVHGVTLPQVTKVKALKAAVGFGALLIEELRGRSAALGEMPSQGTFGDVSFRDRIGLVEFEDGDDGA